jgi:hypothetical protein
VVGNAGCWGDHSRLRHDVLTCLTCIGNEIQANADAERAIRDERMSRFRRIADPTERLVASMRYLRDTANSGRSRPGQSSPSDMLARLAREADRRTFSSGYLTDIESLCPDVAEAVRRIPNDSTGRYRYPWDSLLIGRWFVARAA